MEKESMEYLLIDFENVFSESFSGLLENQKILIFAGENQSKVKMETVRSTQALGNSVEWNVISGSGKNAVDFHIAFYIGRISALDPTAKFKIFSKDKGFDPLIRHLSSNNIQCKRIEEIPEITSGSGIHEFLSVVVEDLMRMDERRRPGKEARLKAWVKDRLRKEDSVVEQVLKGLISTFFQHLAGWVCGADLTGDSKGITWIKAPYRMEPIGSGAESPFHWNAGKPVDHRNEEQNWVCNRLGAAGNNFLHLGKLGGEFLGQCQGIVLQRLPQLVLDFAPAACIPLRTSPRICPFPCGHRPSRNEGDRH